MKSILEQLWYGNLRPFADAKCDTFEINDLVEKMNGLHTAFFKTLSAEQKELLRRYDDLAGKLHAIQDKNTFIYGFQLGTKIAVQALSEDKNSF